MLSNILNIDGAQTLNTQEQKNIQGGQLGNPCRQTICPWKPGRDCWWCID